MQGNAVPDVPLLSEWPESVIGKFLHIDILSLQFSEVEPRENEIYFWAPHSRILATNYFGSCPWAGAITLLIINANVTDMVRTLQLALTATVAWQWRRTPAAEQLAPRAKRQALRPC